MLVGMRAVAGDPPAGVGAPHSAPAGPAARGRLPPGQAPAARRPEHAAASCCLPACSGRSSTPASATAAARRPGGHELLLHRLLQRVARQRQSPRPGQAMGRRLRAGQPDALGGQAGQPGRRLPGRPGDLHRPRPSRVVRVRPPLGDRWRELEPAVDEWRAGAEGALHWHERDPARVRIVAFERLAGRTEATMREPGGWLGIEFGPSLLEPSFNGWPVAANSSFEEPVDLRLECRRSSAGRASCRADERARVEKRAGDVYERALACRRPRPARHARPGAEPPAARGRGKPRRRPGAAPRLRASRT